MSREERPKGRAWRRKVYQHLVDRDGEICSLCGAGPRRIWRKNGSCSASPYGNYPHTIVYPTTDLEVEHVVALSDGGGNALGNLRLLCIACHKAKTTAERRSRGAGA